MLVSIFPSVAAAAAALRRAEDQGRCYGFQSLRWLTAWEETIGTAERVQPAIVDVAAEDGEPIMLLPLGILRHFGLSTLSFLGGEVTDYHSPIVSPNGVRRLANGAFESLWQRILDLLPSIDIIHFEKMPASIEGIPNPMIRLAGAEPKVDSFHTLLDGSFEAFCRRQNTQFRRDTRRRFRNLAEMGRIEFRMATTSDEVHALMPILFRQKTRRYHEAGWPSMFDHPAYCAFYTRLALMEITSGFVSLAALSVGDTVVACHWGIIYGDRFYCLITAHEGGVWKSFSPGRLLLDRIVEWCCTSGIRVLDLTGGDEAYKLRWADRSMPLYQLVQPCTHKGRLALGMKDRVKQVGWLYGLLKQARDRLQGAPRRPIPS